MTRKIKTAVRCWPVRYKIAKSPRAYWCLQWIWLALKILDWFTVMSQPLYKLILHCLVDYLVIHEENLESITCVAQLCFVCLQSIPPRAHTRNCCWKKWRECFVLRLSLFATWIILSYWKIGYCKIVVPGPDLVCSNSEPRMEANRSNIMF